jgi:UDP-4-amino-4,6-dideoxy-N-acetyl-beta-L-altrosamine N-acetyltransferase
MINFIRLKEEHLEIVLKWRTQAEVTRYMSTDIENNIVKQKEWFKQISIDKMSKYWIITNDKVLVGLIGLVDINLIHLNTIWSYYIGEKDYRREMGAIAPLYLYNYVFNNMKLNKIFANCFIENVNMIKILRLHGFRDVGVHKQHYYKNNRFHDVLMMELLADDWKIKKDIFGRFVAPFE